MACGEYACGALLPPVAAQFSDRPSGSLVCPACADIAGTGGPSAGWPLVEVHPTPGGQPDPSPAEALVVLPPRFAHPGRHCAAGIPALLPGGQSDPGRGSEVVFRWGCCPVNRLLHLLDSVAVREVAAVGWAKAACGRLIFAAGLTLRGDSVGMCVSCVAAGNAP